MKAVPRPACRPVWSALGRAITLPILALALVGASTTLNMSPSATVTDVCSMTSPTALAFGNYDPVVTNHTSAQPLNVTTNALSLACTKGAGAPGITIALGSSANAPAGCTAPQRCLAFLGHYLNYQIYTDRPGGTAWESSTTVSYISHSMAATAIPVYGQIPGGQDAFVGASYTDTVVATVNF